MTIREKMRNGCLYQDMGEGLPGERLRCQRLLYEFNMSPPEQTKQREDLLRELLGRVGEAPWIEPPFHAAYGNRISVGDYFYANFNLVIVDDIEVTIGNYVMMAPNVTITATGHPVDPELRRGGTQFSFPVRIEDDVWIGAGAIILPGVTIGRGSVIGAGSVVTRDVPEMTVAVGNPCRILRRITERDREYYYRDRRVEPEGL